MKKVLCFAAAAMTLFASCQKTEIVSNNNDGPQEISLFAINKTATKTPVDGEKFQTTDKMNVVAYLADGNGATAGNFFSATTFTGKEIVTGSGEYIWTGTPARYWPLSTSTINFLAVTENGGNVDGNTAAVKKWVPDYFKFVGEEFAPPAAEKEGYTLVGWSETKNGTPNVDYMPSKNVILYAMWEQN